MKSTEREKESFLLMLLLLCLICVYPLFWLGFLLFSTLVIPLFILYCDARVGFPDDLCKVGRREVSSLRWKFKNFCFSTSGYPKKNLGDLGTGALLCQGKQNQSKTLLRPLGYLTFLSERSFRRRQAMK